MVLLVTELDVMESHDFEATTIFFEVAAARGRRGICVNAPETYQRSFRGSPRGRIGASGAYGRMVGSAARRHTQAAPGLCGRAPLAGFACPFRVGNH